jgi:stalled ribosome alternative rescue factor ArfA
MRKNRNPVGKALRDPMFRQRVVKDKKAEHNRQYCRNHNPKTDFTMTKNGGGGFTRPFCIKNNTLVLFFRQG